MNTDAANGRHAGMRLSPWRVLTGILVVVVALVGVIGVPWYLTQRAPQVQAEAGPRWFGGYFDVTAASVQTSATVGDGTDDAVVLAFVVAAAEDQCEPSWGAAYSLADAARELDLDRRVDSMRQDGAHVAVSFGGALNTELASACTNVEELIGAYSSVLDRYQVSTIDIDLENSNLTDTAAGARRADALAELQQRRGADDTELDVWVTLPTGMDGLTSHGVTAVQQLLDAGVELTGVNAMTMDYNTDLGERTMAEASIEALEAVHRQVQELYRTAEIALPDGGAWAVMGATPMIGQNDVAGEVFTMSDARAFNAFAQENGLARMSMWSINRDRTCGPNYPDVSVVSNACSGVPQGDETFTSVLSAGFDEAPIESVATAAPTTPPTVVSDDPATSPYPIWSADAAYSSGVRVVWHGYVYVAKWWVTGAPEPDDPIQSADQTPWVLVGPVLADDEPFILPTVPAGTYPEWDESAAYPEGSRVVLDDVPYEAGWWTQGENPTDGITDHERSPWSVVEISAGDAEDAG